MKYFNISLIMILALFVSSAALQAYADSTNSASMQDANLKSPLEQFKAGTLATDVKCGNGTHLVIKAEDNTPACVKPDTASILIGRGWADKIVSPSSGNTKPTSVSCNNTLPTPLDFTKRTGTLMLYMPKNSIGVVCVNYFNVQPWQDLVNNTITWEYTQPVSLSLYTMNSSGIFSDPSIAISASRNNVSAGIASNPVVYTVKTGNYSGLYASGFSYFQGFVFAVGYDNSSKISLGNLTWHTSGDYFGPPKSYDVTITGLSGIGFKLIH